MNKIDFIVHRSNSDSNMLIRAPATRKLDAPARNNNRIPSPIVRPVDNEQQGSV